MSIDFNEIKESFDEQYPCHSQAELSIFQSGFESGYLIGQKNVLNNKKQLIGKIVIMFKGKEWIHDGVIQDWIDNNNYLVATHNVLIGGYMPSRIFDFNDFDIRFFDDYQQFHLWEEPYWNKYWKDKRAKDQRGAP